MISGSPRVHENDNVRAIFQPLAEVYNFLMSFWIGKTLGQVRIDSLLGRGGMAEVYLGAHTTLQRQVAVKFLHTQYHGNPRMLERFQREARAVAMLRHPNIVQIYDFNVMDDQPYLVMEYLPGISMSAYLETLSHSTRRLEPPMVCRLLTPLASALQYAHESGVIHRDVKPSNILMASRPGPMTSRTPAEVEPVLTDFGLVRFLNAVDQTATGQIAGTPAYMSPEQARGDVTDERTDIYSLGIVAYEMLAGRVPFESESTVGLLHKQINEPPAHIPGLTPALQNVIDRALAKKSEERFQTPNEFSAAFNSVVEDRPEAATFSLTDPKSTIMPAEPALPPKRKKARIFKPLAAGVLIGLTAFLLLNYLSIIDSPFLSGLPIGPNGRAPGIPDPLPLDAIATLRFQDGAAIVDKAIISALAMPAPPEGSQYEVWLIGGEERRSLGVLSLVEDGKGTLSFVDSQSRNLLAYYDEVEISLEPNDDSIPEPSGQVAYSFALPADGLVHIRHLLVSFPAAPKSDSLIQGLNTDSNLLIQGADELLRADQLGDEARMRLSAESMLNLLVGNQSPEYKDWNEDGEITDPGDGYGLLPNGDNLGYIQAVYSEADRAGASAGASQNMTAHGEHVKICAQNLQRWTPRLREVLLSILKSPAGSDMEETVRATALLADQILYGIDLDGNEKIEPILGEGGALTAYEHAYYMADMPIVPIDPLYIPSTGPESANPSATMVTPTNIVDLTGIPTDIIVPSALPTNISLPTLLPTSLPLPELLPTDIPLLDLLNTQPLPIP